MTVEIMAKELELVPLLEIPAEEIPVEGCYVGDLLSWVMGRAMEKCLWITVMGNVNAIAVAKLADLSAIVLCENAPLDKEAADRAVENGIPVYQSELPAYELAVAVSKLLGD